MNKMGKLSAIERQYWLWVTRPKYYLDENGADREDLDPNQTPDAGWWWTCHKDTRRGDLVLVWRTTPKKDIGYLIQTKSDAYSIKGDKDAVQHGWQWGCDYQVLYKFKYPVTIQDLRNDPHLQGWSPLKANFQSRAPAFRISLDDWERLNLLASRKNPGYQVLLEEVEGTVVVKSIEREEELRRKLIQDLKVLNPFGYDLELYVEPGTGRAGREFVLKGHGGRIDLLCYDKKQSCFVVIELKNVQAGQNTFGQISSYLGWVQDHLRGKKSILPGKKPIGLVISRGYDTRFGAALRITDRIKHLNISDLGLG